MPATRSLLVSLAMELGLSPQILEAPQVRRYFSGAPAVSVELYGQVEEKVSALTLAALRHELHDRAVSIAMDEATLAGRQWVAFAVMTASEELVGEWAPIDISASASGLAGFANYCLRKVQITMGRVVAFQRDGAAVMRAVAREMLVPWSLGPCTSAISSPKIR